MSRIVEDLLCVLHLLRWCDMVVENGLVTNVVGCAFPFDMIYLVCLGVSGALAGFCFVI